MTTLSHALAKTKRTLNLYKKQDWRYVREPRHENHLTIRWYHWSRRPRLCWCYWDYQMSEMRTQAVKFRRRLYVWPNDATPNKAAQSNNSLEADDAS